MKNLLCAAMIATPLLLSACGGGKEDAPLPDPEADSTILEGTIDDSMIDLTGSETVMVLENGAAEGTDQPEPEADAANEGEEDTDAPADEPAPAEPDESTDEAE